MSEAEIIPLWPATWLLKDFAVSARDTVTVRADHAMALHLLLFAQEARFFALRGEMTPERRLKLLNAVEAISGPPR